MKNKTQNKSNKNVNHIPCLHEKINEGVDNSIDKRNNKEFEDYENFDDLNDDEYYEEYGFLKRPDDDFECVLEDIDTYMIFTENNEEIPFA